MYKRQVRVGAKVVARRVTRRGARQAAIASAHARQAIPRVAPAAASVNTAAVAAIIAVAGAHARKGAIIDGARQPAAKRVLILWRALILLKRVEPERLSRRQEGEEEEEECGPPTQECSGDLHGDRYEAHSLSRTLASARAGLHVPRGRWNALFQVGRLRLARSREVHQSWAFTAPKIGSCSTTSTCSYSHPIITLYSGRTSITFRRGAVLGLGFRALYTIAQLSVAVPTLPSRRYM